MAGYEGDYDELRACPACGLSSAQNKSRFLQKTITKPDGTVEVREGLERKCYRCNYWWYERPLNAT